MTTSPGETRTPALLVDVHEAARLLRISTRTLWSMTARGDVPHVRLGRSVRYRPASLEAFLASQEKRGAVR
jgi:excisionase family DNA binding protein